MKYSPQIYARAFAEIAAKPLTPQKEGKIIQNFLALIRKNNDEYQIKKIFAAVEKALRLKTGRRKITIETARPVKMRPNKLLKNFVQETDVFEEKTDPDLIAGIKIIINDEKQFDGTLKRKMDKLFSH